MDDFTKRNAIFFDAFYYFLNLKVNLMKESEIGMDLRLHDFDDETYRDYTLKHRPLKEIIIDDFKVEFSQSEEKGRPKNDGDDNEGSGNRSRSNESFIELTCTKTITISSEKPIEEIHAFINKVYKDYVDHKYPEEDRDEDADPKYYFVRKKKSSISSSISSSSGNGNNGVGNGSFGYVAGVWDRAFKFDGKDDFVKIHEKLALDWIARK